MNKSELHDRMKVVRAQKKQKVAKIGTAYTPEQHYGKMGAKIKQDKACMERLGMKHAKK
jgi:NhaP-type Na+/H+ and K+/H+ antiporter